MDALNLLKELKSKLEVNAAFEDKKTAITEVKGNQQNSTAIIIQEIEGELKFVEISLNARILNMPYTQSLVN